MIQAFDAASEYTSTISLSEGVNAAAASVLRGIARPLSAISRWSDATIDWARVETIATTGGANPEFDMLPYDQLQDDLVTQVQDAANAEARVNAAELDDFNMRLLVRPLPGAAGTFAKIGLGVLGFGGGVGGVIREALKFEHQQKEEQQKLAEQINEEKDKTSSTDPSSES